VFELLGSVAYLDSELTSEIMNTFRRFDKNSWMGDRPITRPLPTQDSTTQKNAELGLCLERDLNP
jgi:hypothetical protein